MPNFKCCEDTGCVATTKDDQDEMDKPPNAYHVTRLNFCALIASIILHCLDNCSDIYVTYSYFAKGRNTYFAWSIAFILLPSFILTAVSIRMYIVDNKFRNSLVRIALWFSGVIIQSAPLIRNCYSLYSAFMARRAETQNQQRKYYDKMLKEDSDTALLKMLEAYLESAPQQVLQSTLLLVDYSSGYSDDFIKQVISITLGFLSMAIATVNYNRCIRFEQFDKENITRLGLVVQCSWHLNFTVSRILAITAVAVLYPLWTCIAAVIHWSIMTSCVAIQIALTETNFCGKNKILELLFSCVLGAVYIFNYVNVNEGPTQKYYFTFFLVFFVENITAVTIWGVMVPFKNWVYYFFIYSPVVCFMLSVMFMVVYYMYLHPNKVKSGRKKEGKNTKNDLFLNNVHEQRVMIADEENK